MSNVEQLMIDGIPQPKYDTIVDLIPSGESHAVRMDSLASILGVDTRTVRLLIQKEREHGHVIAGTDAGLFIPANDLELKEYIARVCSRIYTEVRTINPALAENGQFMKVEVTHE